MRVSPLSLLGSLAALITTVPRVYYAMARDRLFFPGIAAVHPRYGTHARATLLQTVLAGLLIAVGTFEQVVAYFFFVSLLFLALSVAAIAVLRKELSYRTPGYPVTPAIFLQSALGVGGVALGFPLFRIAFRSPAGAGVKR